MTQENGLDPNDLDLDFVREKRKQLINHFMEKGVPDDLKEAHLVATLLTDMDRTALGKKKIKIEKEANNQAATAVELIAKLFMENNVKGLTVPGPGRTDAIPVLEDNLIELNIEPGELEIHTAPEDYDAFMKRVGES